ncbi:MAG: heme exporter protein CcmD [Rhodobacteraceae bacterium]|nr:heme exporter protein CcmD [Paracoccaceae bacterium]
MLPDLGKYTLPVLAAYASMFVLIGGLILVSLRNAKKSKATLARLEANRKSK